jgi:hypothetical protein
MNDDDPEVARSAMVTFKIRLVETRRRFKFNMPVVRFGRWSSNITYASSASSHGDG